VLNIIVPLFDLDSSFGKVKSGESIEKVGNLYSKLCRDPGISSDWFAHVFR